MISCRMIAVIAIAALGPFQFGYNTGVINAPSDTIKAFLLQVNDVKISPDGITVAWSFAVAMFSVGGMIGSLLVGYGANRLGRRFFMFILAVSGVLCGIILGLAKEANSYLMLIVGRTMVGFVSGAYTGVTPMYLSEVAPLAIRGSIGIVNQLAIVTAILISQVFGLKQLLGTETLWPLLLGLTAVPAAIQSIFVLFVCPESPRYLLITKNDQNGAKRIIRQLGIANGDVELDNIVEEMNREAEEQRREKTLSVLDLFKRPELRWPLCIAIIMQLSQQFSGINGIFYYSSSLFINSAGLSPEEAGYATLGVGAIMVAMTIVSIPLVERLGRKILHSTGLAGMLAASVLVTVFLSVREPWAGYVGVVFCLIFVLFFAIGPGSIPWLITSELFAQSSRPPAIAIATFVNWSANFIISMVFEPIEREIHQYVFVIFSVLLLFFLVFTLKFVPETKGRTFQDIAAYFARSTSGPSAPTSSPSCSPSSVPPYRPDQGQDDDVAVCKSQQFLLPEPQKHLIIATATENSHLFDRNNRPVTSSNGNSYLTATQL